VVQTLKNRQSKTGYDVYEIKFNDDNVDYFMLARRIINNCKHERALKFAFKFDERKLIVIKKQLRNITYIVKKKENNKDLTLKDNKKYELRLFLDDLMRKLV
jgi:hypothetical protein